MKNTMWGLILHRMWERRIELDKKGAHSIMRISELRLLIYRNSVPAIEIARIYNR